MLHRSFVPSCCTCTILPDRLVRNGEFLDQSLHIAHNSVVLRAWTSDCIFTAWPQLCHFFFLSFFLVTDATQWPGWLLPSGLWAELQGIPYLLQGCAFLVFIHQHMLDFCLSSRCNASVIYGFSCLWLILSKKWKTPSRWLCCSRFFFKICFLFTSFPMVWFGLVLFAIKQPNTLVQILTKKKGTNSNVDRHRF